MIFNEKAIAKDVLKNDRIFVQHDNDDYYWVADGFWMLPVHKNSPILADRDAFPELPTNGESITYHGADSPAGRTTGLKFGCAETTKGPDLKQIVPRYDPLTDEVTITDLIDTGGGHPARLTYTSSFISYLNEDYYKYLDGDWKNRLTIYQAAPTGPYIITLQDTVFGVIMPMLAAGERIYPQIEALLDVIRKQEEGKKAA